jgi:hypothetical protein
LASKETAETFIFNSLFIITIRELWTKTVLPTSPHD